jgi:phosphatidylglycerol:prolipoprotein diacylglycerol transferase
MISVITISIDPVLHLGPLAIHWYGVMYAVAFTVAWLYGAKPYTLARGMQKDVAERVLFATIICGLIGARLYYVIQQPNLGDFVRHPLDIIAVWKGGMAFFGAIIGSVSVFAWATWRKKLPFWILFDGGTFFAVVGQPIGRIGNIINGDILGSPSNLPWATRYTNPGAVLQACCHLGNSYQPAAAYEALGTIAIGCVLFWLWKVRKVQPGIIAITYVACYALSQFLIFFLRDSEPVIGLGLKQAQWTALVFGFVVVPLLVIAWRKTGRGRWVPAAPTTTKKMEPAG